MNKGPNIQQRVFDALPAYPQGMTIFELYRAVPLLKESIQEALWRLRERKAIERVPDCRFCYRRVLDAKRPCDGRFGNTNRKGKRAKHGQTATHAD